MIQAWTLDSPGLTANVSSPSTPAEATPNDRFGDALAIGDFDGNGFDDLAIGIPGYDFDGMDEGGVLVLYNQGLFANGFESGNLQPWSSTSP